MTEAKKILQGLIDEHRSGSDRSSVNNNSMIDHLLSLQKTEPEHYTDDIIKGLVLVSEIILFSIVIFAVYSIRVLKFNGMLIIF